jgi:hypothetical protein
VTPEQLDNCVRRAIEIIPDGGMGQQSLRQQLSLNDDEFQGLKTELLQQDLVSVYRARGGYVPTSWSKRKRSKKQATSKSERRHGC